jgi:type I restriction enzyme M protein
MTRANIGGMIFRQQATRSLLGPHGSSNSLIWSVRSELRYLEWAIDHLAPGLSRTLIVPDGILFRKDRAYRHVRERLLTECVVRAVVRLPVGIFSDAKGIRVSLLVFEAGMTRQGVIRYYEVPSLTRGQITTRIRPADVLDGAIAWVLGGERDGYSWEVDMQAVRQGDWSLDLRLPGAYAVSDGSESSGQLQLFASTPDSDYDAVAPLAPWIEERGERARHAVFDGLLGVSKHGITSLRGKPSVITHRYRRVEVGDLVYNPTRAELGSIALCRDAWEEGWVSPDYVVFRLTADAPFDPEHLLRFLKSKPGRLEVSRRSRGSVRRRLRYEDLRQIAVPYADRTYAEPLPARQVEFWHAD